MQGFSLGRKIDIRYRSNLWLLLVAAGVAGLAWLLTGSFIRGLGLGGGFFFCWALAREVDPAHDLSAFLAGGIYLLFFSLYDGIAFGILFWLLLLLRMISGICGKIPSSTDLLSLFGLTVYLSLSRQHSLYLFLFTLALLLAFVRYGKDRRFGLSAIFAAALSFISVFFYPTGRGFLFSLDPLISSGAIIVLMAAGGLNFRALKREQNIEDDLGKPLESRWIRLTLLFYVIAVLMLLLLENISLMSFVILYSVLAGVTADQVRLSGP